MRLIDYDLTASDYREYYVRMTAIKLWRFVLVCGLALTAVLAWLDYCQCDYLTAEMIAWDAAEGFGVSILFAGIIVALNAITAKRIHSGLGKLHHELALGWDDEGVALNSAFAKAKYPWHLIEKWSETPSLFVGFLSPYVPFFIPKRVLGEEELADLRQRIAATSKAKKAV